MCKFKKLEPSFCKSPYIYLFVFFFKKKIEVFNGMCVDLALLTIYPAIIFSLSNVSSDMASHLIKFKVCNEPLKLYIQWRLFEWAM